MLERFRLQPLFKIGLFEFVQFHQLAEQLLSDRGIDVVLDHDVAAVVLALPVASDREDDISADEFFPMMLIAEGRDQQLCPVTAFLV